MAIDARLPQQSLDLVTRLKEARVRAAARQDRSVFLRIDRLVARGLQRYERRYLALRRPETAGPAG
jgi:hypothetical protein